MCCTTSGLRRKGRADESPCEGGYRQDVKVAILAIQDLSGSIASLSSINEDLMVQDTVDFGRSAHGAMTDSWTDRLSLGSLFSPSLSSNVIDVDDRIVIIWLALPPPRLTRIPFPSVPSPGTNVNVLSALSKGATSAVEFADTDPDCEYYERSQLEDR